MFYSKLRRSGLIFALFATCLIMFGATAGAQTIEGYIVHAAPASFAATVGPGDTLSLGALVVYEETGAALTFVTYNRQPWLYIDTIPASPLVTPESLFVYVTAPPSPGSYIDTIEIWADSATGNPTKVPVNLIVESSNPDDYLVLTNPQVLQMTATMGGNAVAEVQVFEHNGVSVPFQVWNVSQWLTYSTYPNEPPFYTPHSLEVVATSGALPPGEYYDTLRIYSASDSLPFPEAQVPVYFTVTGSNPDTTYELVTYPTSFDFTVAPGDTNFFGSVNVSEADGANVGFWCYNRESWLMLDTASIIPLVTPKYVPFTVDISLLSPGTYIDTIFVVSSEAVNSPRAVPVTLQVTGSSEYHLATFPTSLEFNLNLGQVGTDSLQVYEVNGASVSFWFDDNASWLGVEPLGLGPYYTPMTLLVSANTGQTGPGTFYGGIHIYNNAPPYDSVIVPVTMHVGPLAPVVMAAPDHFNVTVTPGSNVEDLAMVVYEQYGYSLPFWIETAQGSDWLQVQFPDSLSSPWYTPDSVYFDIMSAGLDPGVYVDSLIIFDPLDDTLTFASIVVPVTVAVLDEEPPSYQVATVPQILEFTASPGVPNYDSLHVFESSGATVGFQFYSTAPWLVVEPFGLPPYATPYTLTLLVNEDTLPAGTYTDSILITPTFDSTYFPTVAVPVIFHVGGGDTLSCGDADGNGLVNITDAVTMINYIFAAGNLAVDPCACDVNGDGIMNITDIVGLIYYIFYYAEPINGCCQ